MCQFHESSITRRNSSKKLIYLAEKFNWRTARSSSNNAKNPLSIKKALSSRQRFSLINPLFFFLSFHHIPQRIQLRFAEQASGVALDHRPARIAFGDLTRSIGLEPVRQDLQRFAVYRQGMQSPLACYIHFGVHFHALSWFLSGLTYPRFMTEQLGSPLPALPLPRYKSYAKVCAMSTSGYKKARSPEGLRALHKVAGENVCLSDFATTQAVTTALTLCAALAVVG
jgi:hypothetical protein